MMSFVMALIQATMAVPVPQLGPVEDQASIVIYGRKLEDAQNALTACIARSCPPKEEIERFLAYAGQQFAAGDYKGSRRTLLRAMHRNARYAATLPKEVSLLHRANARLAGLNGLVGQERVGVIDAVDALKKGLPKDDPAIMLQRLEVGDSYAKQARLNAALAQYRWVADQAVKARQPPVEGMALFRRAVLLSAVASVQPLYVKAARGAVAAIQRRQEPAFLPYRNGTRLMAAMLAKSKDKDAAVDAALAGLEKMPGDVEPVLLYEPPLDMRDAVFGAGYGNDKTQWADVSYRITPDGKVADVHILRASPTLDRTWLGIAMRPLQQRRYAPRPNLAATDPGTFKVARYSFVSDLITDTGTHITRRSSQRRVDVTDLASPMAAPS